MKKTRIVLIAVPVVVVLAVAAIFLLLAPGGPDPAQFEHLRQPAVRMMADQKVLQVEAKGDPEKYLTIIRYRVKKTK